MIAALHLAALGGYSVAWFVQFRGFRKPSEERRGLALGGVLAASAVHLAAGLAFWLEYGSLPLVGLGPTASTLALAIAIVFLIAAWRADIWTAGLLALPFVVLLLVIAVLVGFEPTVRETTFRGVWFVVHVGAALLGYAALLLASVAAAMYLLQFRALKRKRFGPVFRFFPSLDALARVNELGLVAGLTALTVGVVAGWSFTLTFGYGLSIGDPQVVFGVATWLLYATALVVRRWRDSGARAAATVVAFAATSLLFVSLRLLARSGASFL